MKMWSIAVALSVLVWVPIAAQDLDVDLQRAIQQETVSGDLKAAIEAYRSIAQRAGGNRAIAARALVRLADAHRKLGDAEARRVYERIVKDYADQKEPAAAARAALAALRPVAPASTGQAARQIWTGMGVDPMGTPSADGRLLSFTDWSTGDLSVRDLTTGTNRRITDTGGWEKSADYAEFSVVSPNGSEVAYAWFSDKLAASAPYDLRVVSLTNGDAPKPRILYRADNLRWVAPRAWTPDGLSLVIEREIRGQPQELAVLTLSTGAIRTLKVLGAPTQRASVSPNGRYVAYDRPTSASGASRDVHVIGINGANDVAISATPANEHSPLWSADGSHVLFLSNRTGTSGLWGAPMRDGKPGGAHQLIKPDAAAMYPLGITRAGGVMYFSGGDRHNVMMRALDATGVATGEASMVAEHFVNSNAAGTWSPDGQWIAYYSFRGIRDSQGTTLVMRNARTGEEKDIPLTATVQRSGAAGLKWFGDGKALLVTSRELTGASIRRVDLATGTETVLLKVRGGGPGVNNPSISPDGKTLFYLDPDEDGGTRSLMRVDLPSGQPTVLVKGWIHSIAVSPDGATVAYLGTRESVNARTSEIGVVAAGGGEPRVLYTAVWLDGTRFNTLAWTPDGRSLLFVRPEQPGTETIWRVPAAGGDPHNTGITVTGRIKHPSMHPDGRRLLYSVRDITSGAVWLLENFLPARSGS